MNPLEVDAINIDFDNISETIKGSLKIENLYLDGVTSWEFTELSDSINTDPPGYIIRSTLFIPGISGSGSYNGTITFQNGNQVYGEGVAAGSINNLKIVSVARIGLLGGINLSDVVVRVGVGDIEFKITGLFNNEEISQLLSDLISKNLADYINQNEIEIGEYIEDLVFEIIEQIQEGGSGNVIELIQGLINKCLPL